VQEKGEMGDVVGERGKKETLPDLREALQQAQEEGRKEGDKAREARTKEQRTRGQTARRA
jgi:hypothetical protein